MPQTNQGRLKPQRARPSHGGDGAAIPLPVPHGRGALHTLLRKMFGPLVLIAASLGAAAAIVFLAQT